MPNEDWIDGFEHGFESGQGYSTEGDCEETDTDTETAYVDEFSPEDDELFQQ